MDKLFIEDLDVSGKVVLVRVDFNVPLNGGKVANDKRMRAALPTINHLVANGARIVLMSHLGRPKGKVVAELRLKPVAAALGQLLKQEIGYVEDCIGPQVETAVKELKPGRILLLENLRFYPGEEGDDPEFARALAGLGELYINDAFGTAHRSHASTAGITRFVKQSAAGYLLRAELNYLHTALQKPEKPFIAIIGGAKVSSKIGVIETLLNRVDRLLLGGAMTHTFLKAQGCEIGNSVFEEDKVELAEKLLRDFGDRIELPGDYIVSDKFDFGNRVIGELSAVSATGIGSSNYALDIGPESQKRYYDIITSARTVLWNGPMGVTEIDATAAGTYAIARALADVTAKSAITVAGGGDSVAALENAGLADQITHVSTGGGATLEFLENGTLPGIEALSDSR